jgi:(E)-4-hydroxy-3-methylbut-2-enyl-diphosphate synthase
MQDNTTFSQFRRSTDTVFIGEVAMGSHYPVRIQSMTNTLTGDVSATVDQCIRIIAAGADYVRITVPSVSDIESLSLIREKLRSLGHRTSLIADVHFNADIAMKAAAVVEKVRINPGNFGVTGKFQKSVFTPEEYQHEWDKQKQAFISLLGICREHNTAIRIGVNHGSLADRIMTRYGDTPEGMVESALEFLRVCRDENFGRVVVSMKASNTLVMIYATRLLVKRMKEENMHYPLHLGVTEAGEGEDGRIKSAIGIGTLLADGIGDTIRVSLTEEPEAEIPVAQKLVLICSAIDHGNISPEDTTHAYYSFAYARRKSSAVFNTGGNHVPVVIATVTDDLMVKGGASVDTMISHWRSREGSPDFLFAAELNNEYKIPDGMGIILPAKTWSQCKGQKGLFPLFEGRELINAALLSPDINFLQLALADLTDEMISFIQSKKNLVIVASPDSPSALTAYREFFAILAQGNITAPVILRSHINEKEKEDFQLKASVHLGSLLVDGLGDGLWLSGEGYGHTTESCSTAFSILQATRTRITRTEYIACPSCGRTHFSLMETLAAIKAKTSHLKGLKIGVMGCIVNGPGEMADADYGYVGSGKGRVTLYKAREVVKRNIPEASALDELIRVIRENGDWREGEG